MKNQTITFQNLTAAFYGESGAHMKYTWAAEVAELAGDHETAELFRETAKQERLHALAHLKLMYPDATVEDVLKMAIAGETEEYTEMYPRMAREAAAEKDQAAQAEALEQIEESRVHAGQFTAQLQKAQKRFDALTSVEKRHAGQYETRLNHLSNQ